MQLFVASTLLNGRCKTKAALQTRRQIPLGGGGWYAIHTAHALPTGETETQFNSYAASLEFFLDSNLLIKTSPKGRGERVGDNLNFIPLSQRELIMGEVDDAAAQVFYSGYHAGLIFLLFQKMI